MFTNKKKKYFNHKLNGVQKMIWDLEFKREKSLMVREEIRRTYDNTLNKIDVVSAEIKRQLKNPEKICEVHNPEKGKEKVLRQKGKCACEYIENHMNIDELERLYDKRELLEQDRGRYLNQMKKIELDVHGSAPTNEYPDGVEGINQELEALHELQGMLREYKKRI